MFKKMFDQSPEVKRERAQKAFEARVKYLALTCGFTVKDGQIKAQNKTFTQLLESKQNEALGIATSVPLQGATVEILDGANAGKHMGSTALDVALFGPLGLVGVGRVITLKVTGADGAVVIGTCKKKHTAKAHQFANVVNQYKGLQ